MKQPMAILVSPVPLPSRAGGKGSTTRRHPVVLMAMALVPLLFVGIAAPAFAQDRADLERTQILGNRELPKVLTIVPWKRPLPGEMTGRPLASLMDELLQPVDRDVFRRQVAFDRQIHGPPASRAAAAAGSPANTSAPTPATAPSAPRSPAP